MPEEKPAEKEETIFPDLIAAARELREEAAALKSERVKIESEGKAWQAKAEALEKELSNLKMQAAKAGESVEAISAAAFDPWDLFFSDEA